MYEVSQETIQKHAIHFWRFEEMVKALPPSDARRDLIIMVLDWHRELGRDLEAHGVQPLSGGTPKDQGPNP